MLSTVTSRGKWIHLRFKMENSDSEKFEPKLKVLKMSSIMRRRKKGKTFPKVRKLLIARSYRVLFFYRYLVQEKSSRKRNGLPYLGFPSDG